MNSFDRSERRLDETSISIKFRKCFHKNIRILCRHSGPLKDVWKYSFLKQSFTFKQNHPYACSSAWVFKTFLHSRQLKALCDLMCSFKSSKVIVNLQIGHVLFVPNFLCRSMCWKVFFTLTSFLQIGHGLTSSCSWRWSAECFFFLNFEPHTTHSNSPEKWVQTCFSIIPLQERRIGQMSQAKLPE